MPSSDSLRSILLLVAGAALQLPAFAENLGRVGPTYPVAEQDARKYAAQYAREQQISAREVQEKMRKNLVDFLDNLPPVPGIGRVDTPRTRYVEATHVFERDLFDDRGKLLVKAGTRIEMLRYGKLKDFLLLLDGRDPQQVRLLERMWKAKLDVRPVLVAGSYTKLAGRFGRPFYYDYGGGISHHFAVRKVPALVGQEGHRFRVEELKP